MPVTLPSFNLPRICLKSFGIGLAVVFGVYLLLAAYIMWNADNTLAELEVGLASNDTLIEKVIKHDNHIAHQEGTIAHPKHAPSSIPLSQALGDSPKNSKSLTPAPIKGYYEQSEQGLLPIKNGEHLTPFSAYKKPFTLNRNNKNIAIVILDYGLSDRVSEKAVTTLPSHISLVLSPYTLTPDMWKSKAREDGHEIWLDLPIETMNFPFRDPGSKGLLTSASLAYNMDRIEWALTRTTGYAGIATFTDGALNKSSTMFKDLFSNIFDRGLGYLELNPEGGSFLDKNILSENKEVPHAKADATLKIFDTNSQSLKLIEDRLSQSNNTIILVTPTEKNIDDLMQWIEGLEGKNIHIVPVSSIADLREK